MWKLPRSPGIGAWPRDWQREEQESSVSLETGPNTCFILRGSLLEASDLIGNTQFWKEALVLVHLFMKILNT